MPLKPPLQLAAGAFSLLAGVGPLLHTHHPYDALLSTLEALMFVFTVLRNQLRLRRVENAQVLTPTPPTSDGNPTEATPCRLRVFLLL